MVTGTYQRIESAGKKCIDNIPEFVVNLLCNYVTWRAWGKEHNEAKKSAISDYCGIVSGAKSGRRDFFAMITVHIFLITRLSNSTII